jgi:hypothetical protein
METTVSYNTIHNLYKAAASAAIYEKKLSGDVSYLARQEL